MSSVNIAKRVFSGFLFSIALSIISCSQGDNPFRTGADDNPNFIRGQIEIGEGSHENITVRLSRSIISRDGLNENISSFTTSPDENGQFSFLNLEDSFYTLFASDTVEQLSAIVSHLLPECCTDSQSISELKIDLAPKATLYGRVFGDDNITVSILGTDITSSTDSSGAYFLENVPQGVLFLTFTADSEIGFLPIETVNAADTLHIRDIFFGDGRNTDAFDQYVHEAEDNVLYLRPAEYPLYLVPEWYIGKDFSFVSYIDDFHQASSDLGKKR